MDILTAAEAALVRSAVTKLNGGKSLTSAEGRAHAKATRIQEVATRRKLFSAIAAKEFAELCAVKPRQLAAIASVTGLAFDAATVNLFELLPRLVAYLEKNRERLTVVEPPADAATTGLIVTTKFDAAEALKARIGRGSVRMLGDWLRQGMPGTAGGRGMPGRFAIDEMVAWARENLDIGAETSDAGSAVALELKREKLTQLRLETEKKQQARDEERGNILPRDEWTLFAAESITVARSRLMSAVKDLSTLIKNDHERKTFIVDAEATLASVLGQIAADFERGAGDGTLANLA